MQRLHSGVARDRPETNEIFKVWNVQDITRLQVMPLTQIVFCFLFSFLLRRFRYISVNLSFERLRLMPLWPKGTIFSHKWQQDSKVIFGKEIIPKLFCQHVFSIKKNLKIYFLALWNENVVPPRYVSTFIRTYGAKYNDAVIAILSACFPPHMTGWKLQEKMLHCRKLIFQFQLLAMAVYGLEKAYVSIPKTTFAIKIKSQFCLGGKNYRWLSANILLFRLKFFDFLIFHFDLWHAYFSKAFQSQIWPMFWPVVCKC